MSDHDKDFARKAGKRTTEFKAMVGSTMGVVAAYIVGKLNPTLGIDIGEQELVLAITGMVSVYMTVRGWTKAAAMKAKD
jgi:hypothetical protein